MSSKLQLTWLVTKWEFNRFFKLSDLIKGTLFMAAIALIVGTVNLIMGRDALSVPDIAMQAYGEFDPAAFDSEHLNFIDATAQSPDALSERLEASEIDGILVIESTDQGHLIARGERPWTSALHDFLQQARTRFMLHELAVDSETYARLNAAFEIETRYTRGGDTSAADKIVAGAAILLVVIAVFLGFAYQFAAITAEKQQRITEQVVSAIRPQTWIDGKILGITGIGLAYIVYYGFLALVGTAILTLLGMPLGSVLALINPVLLVTFLLLAVLGILMWNAFLAAIAAIIDDPNTSQKNGWLFLPIVPAFFAFYALANPDNPLMKFLGLFPLTSTAVLPARMVLTEVAGWEVLTALVLLAITTWLFRLAAGRIFAAGMLMYGKEPSWREMWRWLR